MGVFKVGNGRGGVSFGVVGIVVVVVVVVTVVKFSFPTHAVFHLNCCVT